MRSDSEISYGLYQRGEQGKMLQETELEERKRYEQEIKRLSSKAPDFVLTVSAQDYVTSKQRSLQDYDLKLVTGVNTRHNPWKMTEGVVVSPLAGVVRNGERVGAEIIVDVRPEGDDSLGGLIGTALIPKKQEAGK